MRDEQRSSERETFAARRDGAEQPGSGDTVHVLHRHEQLAVVLPEIDDLDDVRMGKRSADARLVAEHRHESRVARQLRQDALDRETLRETVRTGASCDVDFRHASSTEAFAELVGTEPVTRGDAKTGHLPLQ